jgi:tripartite-type tricarboxylate transporter receptor subunit TctC
MRNAEFRKRMTDMGLEPMNTSSEVFRSQISAELAKWRRVVKQAGISAQ